MELGWYQIIAFGCIVVWSIRLEGRLKMLERRSEEFIKDVKGDLKDIKGSLAALDKNVAVLSQRLRDSGK